jgi:methylglyoxal synthase
LRGVDGAIERLGKELSSLSGLRWDQPNDFGDFSRWPELAKLLDLSGGRRDVEQLRNELLQITEEVRKEQKDDPPEHDRLLASAWIPLLKLEDRWEGTLLKERRDAIRQQWKTARGNPIKSPASVKEHFETGIYEELARRLLASRAGAPAKPPHKDRRSASGRVPALWPGDGRSPKAGQDIVILIAANAKRRGPTSGLVKLVREFEPYWRGTAAFIYSLEGSHREIWRAGLLHDYEDFAALPAGFYGGLVHATEAVVGAAESSRKSNCHVVYLIDPHDNSSLYPATASIKRQCILNQTPFLTTYKGAARWFRLEWARHVAEGNGSDAHRLLVARPGEGFDDERGLEEIPGPVALAAHDRHKRTLMDLADAHADLLTDHFPERWATQVTGHLLNGGSIEDRGYENDIFLYDAKEESRENVEAQVEQKSKEWRERETESGPGSVGWVNQLTRGRRGGVIQLAHRVLDDECDTVVFLEDAEAPGDQDMEIQVLDRAAQLADGDCLLLYDESSVNRWAENVALCAAGGPVCAITLVEAYRRVFGVELVLAPGGRPRKGGRGRGAKAPDPKQAWKPVANAAAGHLLGVLRTAAAVRKDEEEPVRLGLPWGGVMRDIVGELPEAHERDGLAAAIGLRRFVERTPAKSLFKSRDHAISADEWPPLDEMGAQRPFGEGELRVVPVVGVIGARDRSRESHALVERTVEILGGRSVPYPESAFAFRAENNDPRSAAPTQDWEKLDVLAIHAAALRKRPDRQSLATGLPADLAKDFDGCDCAVGTFYLESNDGEVAERTHESYTQVGISMQQVRDLKESGTEVVLVNGVDNGPARQRAAWAALKAKLASTFVTDEGFAWAVLEEEIGGLGPPEGR